MALLLFRQVEKWVVPIRQPSQMFFLAAFLLSITKSAEVTRLPMVGQFTVFAQKSSDR